MKTISLIIILISVSYQIIAQSDVVAPDSAKMNTIVYDSIANQQILLGHCNRDGLMELSEFSQFYIEEHASYNPNIDQLNSIKDSLLEIQVKIVLGTWCSDSQREVPRFLKLLEMIDIQDNKIEIIAVNRKKEAVYLDIQNLNIRLVPTLIIYKSGKEIGRITESPEENLESDLFKIITSTN